MTKRTCSAIAKSTGKQCKRTTLPGSKYCVFHVELVPLLLGALVGAILSLLLTVLLNHIVPSKESRQLEDAQESLQSMRNEVLSLQQSLELAQSDRSNLKVTVNKLTTQLSLAEEEAIAQRESHALSLERIENELQPFLNVAMSRYPNLPADAALQSLYNDIQSLGSRTSQLEKRAKPRNLTEHQISTLVSHLRALGPRTVNIAAVVGDQEAFNFGKQLRQVFSTAGWHTSEVYQAVYTDAMPGLLITSPTDPPPERVNQVYRALRAAGLSVGGNLDPSKIDDTTYIVVGSKQ